MKRTRAPDLDSNYPRERVGISPIPWFWNGRDATSISVAKLAKGRVVRNPLLTSPPSSFHREERARCLEPKHCNRRIKTCAHDVARCTRFGRAGPARRIRRAPWASLSTHSSRDRAGRRLPLPTAAWTNTVRMAVRALPDARFPIEELPVRRSIHSTAGSPPHLSTKRDSRRERREPSNSPFSYLDREGDSRNLS